MIHSLRLLLFFFCSILVIPFAQGQLKYERESRVKAIDVPPPAVQFVQELKVPGKIKWYLEEGLERFSYEAKFKLNTQKYSVEFDTLGNIQDMEILMAWNDIPENTREKINTNLNTRFLSHKVRKIQIQYAGDPAMLIAIARGENPPQQITIKYELIVKGKQEGRPKLYEITFSDEGDLLQVSEIVFKNSDHLEY